MRKLTFALLAAVTVAALCGPSLAQELGDKAPGLTVAEWLRGGPVELGDGQHTVVVEFWATWCAPCRAAIPHLTELQRKYKDRGLVVVGVSVDEDQKRKTRKDVPGFVKEQGDKMDYVVALDTAERTTMAAYLDGFMFQGIPTAFIVDKDGKVVWGGSPTEIDTPLQQVLDGKFDLKEARLADKKRREEVQRQIMATQTLDKYFELVSSSEKPEGAAEFGMLAVMVCESDASLLNRLAWDILTHPDLKFRDVKLALRAAKKANEVTSGENAAIVDTYARALFDNGQVREAIEHQKKAIALAKDDQMRSELQATLVEYEQKSTRQ